ncbi:efflux RND transporter periplasmic adaptor subunit [Gloeobacter kilaueensis]|uniref:Efflux transporter, RND family, MFP subunit n=1 Tax=Gloeobacter kilaueensis (strain ATCC BAA-2537 / CCAP 1431/1 / ULC 316 / JS1) TaxID=1183438 RepID=U5QK78_GLOK1|nr:efflux RND transporter periplasmic adaptor subunit [Gloeobacter kilaueensis]AGY59362.1 efflux transporter, RND family, MFP subunit [Gloeobacter kilaueensis JS1]
MASEKSAKKAFSLKGPLLLVAIVAGLAGLFALGFLPRLQRQRTLEAEAGELASKPAAVSIVRPTRSGRTTAVRLPGNIQALSDTVINARADGYLERRTVDIGDRVQAGQLLAVIETPELDQQVNQQRSNLAQAQADLKQRQVNLDLYRTTLERWQNLGRQGAVARQDVDERTSTYQAQLEAVAAQQATIRSQQAELNRLLALQNFKQVRSPYAGIITARNVDNGALVSSSGNTRTNLFTVAKTDRVRIFINVPQPFAPGVKVGQSAHVLVQEYPAPFTGRITRTAGALDPASRTMLTEVQVDNRDGRLLPGMYAQVELSGRRTAPPLVIPASTLIVRAAGPEVAVVGINSTIHLQKIALGRDFGDTVEVVSGLTGNEQLVVNPTDDAVPGAKVQVERGAGPS